MLFQTKDMMDGQKRLIQLSIDVWDLSIATRGHRMTHEGGTGLDADDDDKTTPRSPATTTAAQRLLNG